MEIERCRQAGDEWHPKVRHRGQIVFVAVARAEIDALIESGNPSEATVLDMLREQHAELERAVDATVLGNDRPEPFASMTVVRDWE